MPGLYDPNLDDDENDESSPQLASGGTLIGSQSSSGAQSQEKGSGRFQNLQDYLSANQGGATGEKFSQKLNEDIAGAQPKIQQAETAFKSQSDVGTTKYNADLVNRAVGNPNEFVGAQDFIKNQSDVDAFKKQRDAQYKGKHSLAEDNDSYQQAYGAAQKAQSTANAAQKEGGRFALLNEYFGSPSQRESKQSYSQGEKNLDQLLVSRDPKAQAGIAQAKANAQAVQQSFDQTQKNVADYALQNAKATQEARNKTREALGINDKGEYLDKGAVGSSKGSLQNILSGSQAKNNAEFKTLKDRFDNRQPTLSDLRNLGLLGANDDSSIEYYQSNPLSEYLTQARNPETLADVADPNKVAYMKALQQLADGGDIINYEAKSLYDPKASARFDQSKFRQDSKDAYSDKLLPAYLVGSDSPISRPGLNLTPGQRKPDYFDGRSVPEMPVNADPVVSPSSPNPTPVPYIPVQDADPDKNKLNVPATTPVVTSNGKVVNLPPGTRFNRRF